MMELIVLLLKIAFFSFVTYGIWNMFFLVFLQYLKAKYALGSDQVKLIYRPLTNFMTLMSQSQQLYQHSHGYYHEIVKRHPQTKLIFIKVLGITLVYVVDSEMVKTISNKLLTHVQRIFHMPYVNELDKGLLFSTGQRWKKSRKIISDLFHFQKLKYAQNTVIDIIDRKINQLDGKSPNMLQLGKAISSQVVLTTLLGLNFSKIEFKSGQSPFKTWQNCMELILKQNLKIPYLLRTVIFGQITRDSYFLSSEQKKILQQIDLIKKITYDYVVNQKKKAKESQNVSPFIKAYLKENDDSFNEEIQQQILSFMIAGTDTTGALIQSAISHLAAYPEYQERILKDLDNHKQNIHDSIQLNNFVNEVLRLRGSVQMGAPLKIIVPIQLQKYTLSKDMNLVNCYAGVAKNPLYWDNPLQFNPDRYKQKNQSFSLWMPFGTGPRSCIGKHMALIQTRLAVVRILKKYKLQKIGKSLAMNSHFVVNAIKDRNFVKFIQK